MSKEFMVSCLQTNATPNQQDNLEQIEALMAKAYEAGADFVALPEACDYLDPEFGAMRAYAQPVETHRALARISGLVSNYGYWCLIGSLTVRTADGDIANRSFLIKPNGDVAAYYDKIHMFDANIPGNEGSKESDIYRPGDKACLASLPWGRLGMTICYDLRFPHLYRDLAHAGAEMMAVPAAFAKMTGQAHWHSLLRARAIENTCFVIAPGQTGHHYNKRYSYGHSLIIDPWGTILADAGDEIGIITAKIDLGKIDDARSVISSLHHDREFQSAVNQ